jgi:nucleotide-binding universal stress UspA family protein
MKDYIVRKILAPIDFSEISINALHTAISIAKKHNASLTIIHVMENTRFLYTAAGGLSAIALLPELLRTANEKLSEIANSIRDKDHISIRHAVLSGNAAEGICQEAWRDDVDLVVLGSHGTSNIREVLIGSTAYFVVKSCPVPVLTIPSDNHWSDFRRILFPVRANSHSYEKLEFIRPIIHKEGSSVLLAGIIDKNEPTSHLNVELTVSDIHKQMTSEDITCGVQFFECKNLAQQVLEIADHEKPDLIVISTTIQTNLWDIFSVSFSQNIVNHSHFPVLSIRPRLEIEAQLRAVEYVDERLGTTSLALN